MVPGCSKMTHELSKSLVGLVTISGLGMMLMYTYMGRLSSFHVINNIKIYSNHMYDFIKQNSPFKNITIPRNYIPANLLQNGSSGESKFILAYELSNKSKIIQADGSSEKSKTILANVSSDRSNVTITENSQRKVKKSVKKKPLCEKKSKDIVGTVFVDQTVPEDMRDLESTLSITEEYGGLVHKGGWWSPVSCKPRKKVAILIPFRNREKQLMIFLRHMHPILQRQQLYYRIFVIEQLYDDPFNRAALFNIGFVESLKLHNFNCFIFTDVDLLPENDRNSYGCPTSPRHMSVAVDKFKYKLPYTTIFGGAGAFTRKHFLEINGFSNLFWGWGGEDDDLYGRIKASGFKLTRPSMKIGRYTMVKIHHVQSDKPNPERGRLLRNTRSRMSTDGLNTLQYKLISLDEEPLVTFIRVELKRSMYT